MAPHERVGRFHENKPSKTKHGKVKPRAMVRTIVWRDGTRGADGDFVQLPRRFFGVFDGMFADKQPDSRGAQPVQRHGCKETRCRRTQQRTQQQDARSERVDRFGAWRPRGMYRGRRGEGVGRAAAGRRREPNGVCRVVSGAVDTPPGAP